MCQGPAHHRSSDRVPLSIASAFPPNHSGPGIGKGGGLQRPKQQGAGRRPRPLAAPRRQALGGGTGQEAWPLPAAVQQQRWGPAPHSGSGQFLKGKKHCVFKVFSLRPVSFMASHRSDHGHQPETCVVKWTNYPDEFQFSLSRSNSPQACSGAASVKCGLHGGLPA